MRYTPSGPVAGHCEALLAVPGASLSALARAAHVDPTVIRRILAGTRASLEVRTAERILAVDPDAVAAAHRGRTHLVDAAPARAWVRDLMATGATPTLIARLAGCSPSTVIRVADGRQSRLDASAERLILAVDVDEVRATTMSDAARVEDIEWMLDSGEHPDRVARRIGMQRDSIGALLRRTGRADLVERMSTR